MLRNQLAARMMDLLEAYCPKEKDEEKWMKSSRLQSLQMNERFNPFSEELQIRRDELKKRVDSLVLPDMTLELVCC